MNLRFFQLRDFGGLILALLLAATCGCDPSAKALRAGPFSGQVVDAETGQPVPGAFVGFRWSGQSAIHGTTGCRHAVLVQADAEGRYAVTWQGNRLNTSGAIGVGWSQDVWAPGYVLLSTGEDNLLRGGIVKAERDPKVSIDQGVNEARREQSVVVGTTNTVIPLQRASSAMEALDRSHRPIPSFYTCGSNEEAEANREMQQALGKALYRDSYRRVCEESLPDEALIRKFVQTPDWDRGGYQGEDIDFATTDERYAFYKRAGWMQPSGAWVKDAPPLDRGLLPELCRLQRYSSGFQGS